MILIEDLFEESEALKELDWNPHQGDCDTLNNHNAMLLYNIIQLHKQNKELIKRIENLEKEFEIHTNNIEDSISYLDQDIRELQEKI